MAGVSCFIPFSCKTLSPSLYQTQGHLGFGKKNSLSSGKGREVAGLKFPIGGGRNRGARPVLRIRATGAVADDDEWGPGNEEWTGEAVATGLGEEEKEEKEEKKPIEASKEEKEEEKEEKKPIEASKEEKEEEKEEKKPIEASKEEKKEEKKPIEPSKVDKLKKALVDSLYGTDRGLNVSSEKRAEIVELITQLEALNPTPAPTEALTLLNGKWILAYTSFSGLFPLLASGALPLVKVEEISQTIDAQNLTVQNAVQFSGPLATTSLVTNAKFDIRSPKRVQLKFDEGIIGTPQLTDSIETPENVDVLGQKIDLSPLKGLLTSLEDTASSVAKTISSQPPLKIPISGSNAQSWLLTTYLDEELRISRGDGGSVFVLIKEGSSLLTS